MYHFCDLKGRQGVLCLSDRNSTERVAWNSFLTHSNLAKPCVFTIFFAKKEKIYEILCLIYIIFVNYRVDQEIADRNSAESGLTTRIDKEIVDREEAISEIKNR